MVYKRNLEQLPWTEMGHGERFHHQRRMLTPLDQPYVPKLGISQYRLQPGKRAFPFHEHYANDEAILVTKGSGTLRYGSETIELGPGDYVHLPAGSGSAHQVINTSDGVLEYFCLSTAISPEIVQYPDSNKVGAWSMTVSADGVHKSRRGAFLRNVPLDYWDGEEPA
jgi:uncharacterized cupin superfamily protein